MNYYAGVGSRLTPERIQAEMTALAAHLAKEGWCLRSGAANGADAAFEKGCDYIDNGKKQIFLPWKGFNSSTSPLYIESTIFTSDIRLKAFEIVRQLHPAWHRLSVAARKLHARNVFQVLGPTLQEPVKLVICWTLDGKTIGGTATAINLAKLKGIPVCNMGGRYYYHG